MPLMIFILIGVPFTILNPIARLMLKPGTIDETRLMLSTWIGALGMIVATLWSTGTHVRIKRWCQSRVNGGEAASSDTADEEESETLLMNADDDRAL